MDVKERRRKRLRRFLAALVVCLLTLMLTLWYVGVMGGNVRTIAPGRAYRSAQLTGIGYTAVSARMIGNDFDSVLRSRKIRTVINLRGGSAKDDWYRAEVSTCAHQDVDHVDIPISARKLPPPERLNQLLDTFDHARYPVLIHCQAGADRTGLASVLYAHLVEKIPLDRAEQQELTFRYGHISVGKTRAMDDFFDLYRKEGHGKPLREWIETDYPALYAVSPERILPQHDPALSSANP